MIPGSGRFPGEGNGNPLQYSCLENPMDRGAWCPWGHKESDTTEQLHFHFLAIKKNKIMPFGATLVDLEIIILREVIEKEKDKYHMTSLICRI